MKVKCPECGERVDWSRDNPYRPFCSERCKLVDLGAWAAGNRFIPGEEIAQEADEDDESSLPFPSAG